ncbi:MAG: hypothetical protein JWO31_3726, partial [Phycisphaerales bacterium]|nr:hypothetical protein [Phycisphaerales bacterium]
RAVGTIPGKRLAAVLYALATGRAGAGGEPAVRAAADDALVEMTQRPENARDPAAWDRWWREAAGTDPDRFRADLLDRARRRRPAAGLTGVDALVNGLYQLAPPGKQADALRRTLDAPDAPFRAAGLRLAYGVYQFQGALPDEANTLRRIREMVRDPAPDVRIEAAKFLSGRNDRASLAPLLAQSAAEPDAGVRATIAGAVVPFGASQAAPELVRLMTADPSLRVATVAAESLAKLAGPIQADPAVAGPVATALRAALDGPRAAQDVTGDFRAACAEALVPLRDPQFAATFTGLLRPTQPPRVRRAALAGIGELRDTGAAGELVVWLQRESDPDVRRAALAALRRVGSFQYAEVVYRYVDANNEPDAGVRAAAWDAFVGLLPGAGPQELNNWAERFRNAGQWDRRATALEELVRKQDAAAAMVAAADGSPKSPDAAITREQVAESYMKTRPPQPQQAARYYGEALAYWLARGNAPGNVDPLVMSRLDALLAAKLYPDAVLFANQTIDRDPGLASRVTGRVTTTAEALVRDQPQDAARLAAEARRIKSLPPSASQTLDQVAARARDAGAR